MTNELRTSVESCLNGEWLFYNVEPCAIKVESAKKPFAHYSKNHTHLRSDIRDNSLELP